MGMETRTHNSLPLLPPPLPPIRHHNLLLKHTLIEPITPSVINANLNLLYNNNNRLPILEAVVEVALAEHVVEVLLEAVVDLVDDEDLLHLLDDFAATAVVDDF